MTIAWTGTSGLFTRLGQIGQLLYDIDTYAGTTLLNDTNDILGEYLDDEDLIDNLNPAFVGAQNSALGYAAYLVQLAGDTVNKMVYDDNPLSSRSNTTLSLQEVIRQMQGDSQTVLGYTVDSSISTSDVTLGNGVCVASTKLPDGTDAQTTFAEHVRVQVVTDSSSSSGLAGVERFQALGQAPEANVLSPGWPAGSGCQPILSAINATRDNSGGNLLSNSDFETFATAPTGWTVVTGTAGTQVQQSTAQHYTGASSLKFVGDSTTLTAITQEFTAKSETVYQFAVWLKIDSAPAAGSLQFGLVDGSGTVVNDEAGNANTVSVNCHTLTTSWVPYTGTFRTPYVLPSAVKLRLKLTTPVSTGSNVFVDHLGLGLGTLLYAGGPTISVFSGSNNFYKPDFFTIAFSNTRPSNLKSFGVLCERLFGLSRLGLQLPYSGSPSISDGLIA